LKSVADRRARRSSLRTVGGLAVAFVLVGADRLLAQDQTLYVAAGPMFLWQSAGTPLNSPDMPQPGIGGTALGLVGTLGVMVSSRLSVAAEVSLPDRFVARQELRYSFSALYESRHRDLIASLLLHVHGRSTGRVRPEFVAGVSYVREDTLQRTASQTGPAFPPTGVYGPFFPEQSLTRDTFAFTVGEDVGIPIAKRLTLVPQARLHWIARADLSQPDARNATLFLGSVAVRAALALRAIF